MFSEIKEIIYEAGEILKRGFYENKDIKLKGIKDLVTNIDVEVEEFLKNKLSKFNYNFIAEESFVDYSLGNTFIIDPIDGTTNFAHQIPHVSISVAVYENAKPKYGFVYNPILEEFFSAIKGEGAYLNNEKIVVSKIFDFQRALIATGFPYSSAENRDDLDLVIKKLYNVLPKCQDIRRLGSAALDLCYVACGRFDGFYEMNLKPWDVAAGMLILQEAKGEVSNIKGDVFDMFSDKFIVATNGKIHKSLVKNLV